MLRRATLGVFALLIAVAGGWGAWAASSPAATKKKHASIYKSKYLWATINICDTADHPDSVGVRASMAGSGIAGEEMYIRFQLQYFSRVDGHWHNLGASGDSGFIDVGSARYRARETGRTFTVVPSGTSSLLRGAVTYEWRRKGEVVRRARKRTAGGHANTTGADPAGYSASHCEVNK